MIHARIIPVFLVTLSLLAGAATVTLPAQTAADAKTYKVQNGASPWFDRVGTWELADLPPALVNDTAELPQQGCGTRSITKPAWATSLLLGVSQKDGPSFATQFPAARATTDVFSVKNPNGGAVVAYTAVFLPEAPAQINPTGMQAGLILLRLDPPAPDGAVSAPSPFAAATPAPGDAVPAVFAVPARDKFQVYLLMGQSNMLGRDESKLAEQVEDPLIGNLDGKGGWTVARDPLFGGSGAGLGIPFAQAMKKTLPAGAKIGLVQCAVGGTPLSRWVKGGDLYERALARAKLAARQGTLKAMLWHQGESDANKAETAATYEARLTQMIASLRADLGLPNLPVVLGKLGPFLDLRAEPFAAQVNAALVKVSTAVPHVGLVDSTGLKDKGDHLHFNAESQAEFGRRYAQALGKL